MYNEKHYSIININGVNYNIDRNDLYKSQDDNKLTFNELVKKYESRIISGTL